MVAAAVVALAINPDGGILKPPARSHNERRPLIDTPGSKSLYTRPGKGDLILMILICVSNPVHLNILGWREQNSQETTMSNVIGEVESKVQAEVAQLANVGLSAVEAEGKAEVAKVAPLVTSFVSAHDLWFVGGAFALGLVIGLVL